MSRYDSSPVYFGVDIGTQGIRGTAWQNGQVLTRAQRQLITHTPQNGWAVQQLDEIWENFVLVVRDMADICYQKRYIVRGIGLDATASMVMVDSSGHSLTDVLLWMDIRGHKYTSLISTLTGMSESAELPWSKALWLLEHSDSGLPADRLLVEVADWIVWRLTGIWSRSESSAILKWHGKRPTFLAAWIDHFPNIVAMLPTRVVGIGEKVGLIRPDVLGDLHLAPHSSVSVAAPIIDAYAGAIGSGSLQEGTMALILGTSTCALFHGKFEPTAGLWGPFPDFYHVGLDVLEAGHPSTGSVVRWVERHLGRGLSLDELDGMAQTVPPGCLGLKVLPAFQGIRSPWPNAHTRGMIHGLSLVHDVGHLLRAVYEGTAVDVRRVMDVLAPGSVQRIVVSGGGVHSSLWIQIIADVCGLPLELADDDATTRGACLLAAKADGAVNSLAADQSPLSVVAPTEAYAAYQQIYREYLREFPTYSPAGW